MGALLRMNTSWPHCVTCTCCNAVSNYPVFNASHYFEEPAPAPIDVRLARRERERKLLSDQRSRASVQPQRGAPPRGARLSTYRDAMAARMAARRIA